MLIFKLVMFVLGFFRLAITPIKPGPAAISDPSLGVSGRAGSLPDIGNTSVILSALSNNGSPAFGNWSQTLVPNSLLATTLTGPQMVGGIIRRFNASAAFTDSTDTATNIVNAIPGAVVNQTFPMIIANLGSGAINMTLGAGTGVTIAGTATIAGATARLYLGQVTGSAAVTLTSCFGWNLGIGGTNLAGL